MSNNGINKVKDGNIEMKKVINGEDGTKNPFIVVIAIVGVIIILIIYYVIHPKPSDSLQSSDNSSQTTPTSTDDTQSTSTSTSDTQSIPTSTSAPQFIPTGTGVTQSTPTITSASQSSTTSTNAPQFTPTGTGVTQSTPTGTGVTQSTPTAASSSKPTSTSTSSSKPTSTSTSSSLSTSSTSITTPVVPPSKYLHIEECNGGWVGLTTDHAGDAYIDGSFLNKNYIGKVEDGRKINGWKFNLFIDGASMSLIVCPNQSGFSCEAKTTYENAPAFERPVHITAEYAENNQLKISFFIEDAHFNLTTLNKISVTSSTTPVPSPSRYSHTIDDDYYNGWVGLMDGQTGDAYIYGGFLGENYIGKVENGHKINGWKINLYTHGISISIYVYPNQNGFYYESKQITTYEDAPTYEWPMQITAEYTENDGLIVSFFVEDYAFDLTSLYKVTIENCKVKV